MKLRTLAWTAILSLVAIEVYVVTPMIAELVRRANVHFAPWI